MFLPMGLMFDIGVGVMISEIMESRLRLLSSD